MNSQFFIRMGHIGTLNIVCVNNDQKSEFRDHRTLTKIRKIGQKVNKNAKTRLCGYVKTIWAHAFTLTLENLCTMTYGNLCQHFALWQPLSSPCTMTYGNLCQHLALWHMTTFVNTLHYDIWQSLSIPCTMTYGNLCQHFALWHVNLCRYLAIWLKESVNIK